MKKTLPVWDSRLGDSRPGRPGWSSLGLSWIPAPEQRFGGRPGRELEGKMEGERERKREGGHREIYETESKPQKLKTKTKFVHLLVKLDLFFFWLKSWLTGRQSWCLIGPPVSPGWKRTSLGFTTAPREPSPAGVKDRQSSMPSTRSADVRNRDSTNRQEPSK